MIKLDVGSQTIEFDNVGSQTIEFDNVPLIEPKLDGYHHVRIRGAVIHMFGGVSYEMGDYTNIVVIMGFVHPSMEQQKSLVYWIYREDMLIHFMQEFNIFPNKNRSLVYECPLFRKLEKTLEELSWLTE